MCYNPNPVFCIVLGLHPRNIELQHAAHRRTARHRLAHSADGATLPHGGHRQRAAGKHACSL